MFPKENLFFQFLLYGKDKTQKYYIIKHINQIQFNFLKKIAGNILSGTIPLRKNQLEQLKKSKSFVRNLSEGKVKKIYLSHNCSTIIYMVKIALQYYETCSKVCSSTHRKMGKSKRKGYEFKRSDSSSTNSESNELRNSEERGFYSGVSSGFSSNIEENSRQSEQEETNRFGEKEISDISLASCEEEK